MQKNQKSQYILHLETEESPSKAWINREAIVVIPAPNPQVHISKFGFVRLTVLFKAVSGSCLNDNRKRGNESPFPVPERLDEGGVMTWPQD